MFNNNYVVCIFGATSHIAKGLIHNFLCKGMSHLHLFTTSPLATSSFIQSLCPAHEKRYAIHNGYQEFESFTYDVVINCIGVGTHKKLCGDFTRYFTVGEEYDNMIIKYLDNQSPETLYISFSSGAVYGRSFTEPVTKCTENQIKVNHVAREDYYSICKLNSEAKHRAFGHLRIIDLRLFSYFSRFIDLSEGYFIADIINSVKNNTLLVTDSVNIIRDYIHPDDLYEIVLASIKAGKVNDAFDVNSAAPVDKQKILKYFSDNYGLKYITTTLSEGIGATGEKKIYYSKYNKLSVLGCQPAYSSMETVMRESSLILDRAECAEACHGS